jgi:GT2 family glycosyltransferase
VKTALVTTVSGRHEHLCVQLLGVSRCERRPDRHIVVAMDDPEVVDICGDAATVISRRRQNGRLPVAAARNAGAVHALQSGAELLVFLDVDCVPGPRLFARYEAAAEREPGALLSGPVAYLPPAPPDGYVLDQVARSASAHPDRPMPDADQVLPLEHDLFWSLSFAVRAEVWSRLGGFYDGYSGYGAEDTDFAQLARVHDIPHLAVGSAWAYHQWHPAPDPPLQHLHDILRNGRTFRDRWGWWPMADWLHAFQRLGLVTYDRISDDWILSDPGTAPQR